MRVGGKWHLRPWQSYGNHAGSAGQFREVKGTTFEGGERVPFIAHWPGTNVRQSGRD